VQPCSQSLRTVSRTLYPQTIHFAVNASPFVMERTRRTWPRIPPGKYRTLQHRRASAMRRQRNNSCRPIRVSPRRRPSRSAVGRVRPIPDQAIRPLIQLSFAQRLRLCVFGLLLFVGIECLHGNVTPRGPCYFAAGDLREVSICAILPGRLLLGRKLTGDKDILAQSVRASQACASAYQQCEARNKTDYLRIMHDSRIRQNTFLQSKHRRRIEAIWVLNCGQRWF
jgi:hypothetical protein